MLYIVTTRFGARHVSRHAAAERTRAGRGPWDIRMPLLCPMTRSVLLLAGVLEDLLAVQIPLRLDSGMVLLPVFMFDKLLPVTHMPLRHEVVLDPDDFSQGFHNPDLPPQTQSRMTQDRLGHDLLHQSQGGAEMDVLYVQGVLPAEPDVHHADLVAVFPVVEPAGVRAELVEVSPEEGLAVQHLRRVLGWHGVEGALERRGACREGARGDVVLQELLVDDVDDGGDQYLDVFRGVD